MRPHSLSTDAAVKHNIINYEQCQQLDLKAGSMYPILMRLADRGLLETTWETDAPVGRPAWSRAFGHRAASNVTPASAPAEP